MSAKIIDVDRGWKELKKTLKSISEKNAYVKVGVIGQRAAKTEHEGGISNVDLAVIHEYGAPAANIPPRPFIASTFETGKAEYAGLIRDGLRKVYGNRLGVRQLLGLVGAKMANDVKARVRDGSHFASNAPATLERKHAKGRGRAKSAEPKPLIDTGRLIGSVSWEVNMGGSAKGDE